jgi:hypothetical protein
LIHRTKTAIGPGDAAFMGALRVGRSERINADTLFEEDLQKRIAERIRPGVTAESGLTGRFSMTWLVDLEATSFSNDAADREAFFADALTDLGESPWAQVIARAAPSETTAARSTTPAPSPKRTAPIPKSTTAIPKKTAPIPKSTTPIPEAVASKPVPPSPKVAVAEPKPAPPERKPSSRKPEPRAFRQAAHWRRSSPGCTTAMCSRSWENPTTGRSA